MELAKPFENKYCLYVLHVESRFYKFGITTDCAGRLKTHYRDMNFASVIKIFDCEYYPVMLKVEHSVKIMARELGELIRKYEKTEIIETDDIEKYLSHIDENIKLLASNKENIPEKENKHKIAIKSPNVIDIVKLFVKKNKGEVLAEKEKIYEIKGTRTLANGEKKNYIYKRKYTPKGYVHADGTRAEKFTFSDEQIAEIKQKLEMGVSRKKIISDYKCNYSQLAKVFPNTNKEDDNLNNQINT